MSFLFWGRPSVGALNDVTVLPQRPGELRWMLAKRLGLAATLMALAAAGIALVVETRRAEQTALETPKPAFDTSSPRPSA